MKANDSSTKTGQKPKFLVLCANKWRFIGALEPSAGRVNRDLAGIPHIVECDIDTSGKGYVLYSNLLLMQWARYSTGTNGELNVKFAKPFADKNYFVAGSDSGNIGAGHDYKAVRISDAQTVWLKSPGTTGCLIAIGKAKS